MGARILGTPAGLSVSPHTRNRQRRIVQPGCVRGEFERGSDVLSQCDLGLRYGSFSVTCSSFAIAADDKEKAAAVTDEDGKYFDADGNPTFKIEEDGAVDWYTFSGYRRYHSDCHVCHGPDGVGSSYAPALADP